MLPPLPVTKPMSKPVTKPAPKPVAGQVVSAQRDSKMNALRQSLGRLRQELKQSFECTIFDLMKSRAALAALTFAKTFLRFVGVSAAAYGQRATVRSGDMGDPKDVLTVLCECAPTLFSDFKFHRHATLTCEHAHVRVKQVVEAEFFFIVSIPTSDSSVSVNLHSLIETELCSQNDVFMADCPTCATTVQHTQAFALGANVD